MTAYVPPEPPSIPFEVKAEEGTALYAMLSILDNVEAEAKESAARLKALKDGIKAELTIIPANDAGDPYEKYRVVAKGVAPRLLRWKIARRVDVPRLKQEQREIYDDYSVESGAWYLEHTA